MNDSVATQLQDLISHAQWDEAVTLVQQLDPKTAAEKLPTLPIEQQRAIFRLLRGDFAAVLLSHLSSYDQSVLQRSRSRELRLITQSLLDRLSDDEPGSPADPPVTRTESFRAFKKSLRRDLEWLLNTRQTPRPAPDGFRELRYSLYNYGLPDLVSLSAQSVRDRTVLQRCMQEAVEIFESRLSNVRVVTETILQNGRTLRFRIEGLARLDQSPEQVSFDTVLELTSGEYEVK